MNIQELKSSDRIIFEAVGGSHAYGIATPNSDLDIRGVFKNPQFEYMGLEIPSDQITDKKHDVVYYSLKRFFELLMLANPNIIEFLFMPEDCIKITSSIMQKLIANRNLFISKKTYYTHSGYAFAQIKKAKGQYKMVNNPCSIDPPKKEDFCWAILDKHVHTLLNRNKLYPCQYRPVPIQTCSSLDLTKCHVAALEHVPNTFRLYAYGDQAKGVFRGNGMLVCESIPLEDETKCIGLLIYNQNEYEKAQVEHKKYWEWVNTRNESRWIDQEQGKLDFDQKNMCHCMRLLYSGENILLHGEPIVRFTGDKLQYLMDIRYGKVQYDSIMKEVEIKMKQLEDLYETSLIPYSVDRDKIDSLYKEVSI
jgi:predicted nucleotidyltransferase